jgi:hypothetical protein
MLDQTGRSQSELRVDALVEGIEAAKFLASLASVLVVIWTFVTPLMALRGASGEPFWLAFLFALAFGTFFFYGGQASRTAGGHPHCLER